MIIKPKQIFLLSIGDSTNKRPIGIYQALKLIDESFISEHYDSICFNRNRGAEIAEFLVKNKFAKHIGQTEFSIGGKYKPRPTIQKMI